MSDPAAAWAFTNKQGIFACYLNVADCVSSLAISDGERKLECSRTFGKAHTDRSAARVSVLHQKGSEIATLLTNDPSEVVGKFWDGAENDADGSFDCPKQVIEKRPRAVHMIIGTRWDGFKGVIAWRNQTFHCECPRSILVPRESWVREVRLMSLWGCDRRY